MKIGRIKTLLTKCPNNLIAPSLVINVNCTVQKVTRCSCNYGEYKVSKQNEAISGGRNDPYSQTKIFIA